MPSRSDVVSGPGGSFQTPNGDAAFYGQDFVDEHTAGNRFRPGDNPGGKQKVVVKPSVKANPKSVGKAAVSGLRRGIPGAVLGAATQALLNSVDAVIDSSGAVRLPSVSVDGDEVSEVLNARDFDACTLPSSRTLNKYIVSKYGTQTFRFTVIDGSAKPPAGFQFHNYCISASLGYKNNAQGLFPTSYRQLISDTALEYSDRPAGDADWNKMEAFASAQSSSFVRDLLKETCAGALSPGRCVDDLTSWHDLSGPSQQLGPASTTTSQTRNPDGTSSTTVTSTQNKYDYKYGNTYYDYSTTTTTNINRDGVITTVEESDKQPSDESPSENEEPEYTFEDADFPPVTSFYERKYPDGLQGVWSKAKTDLDNSAFIQFLYSFVPSFSGSCPSFGLNMNISSWAAYGFQSFSSICYVLDFVKAILLVTALFTARAITFGG